SIRPRGAVALHIVAYGGPAVMDRFREHTFHCSMETLDLDGRETIGPTCRMDSSLEERLICVYITKPCNARLVEERRFHTGAPPHGVTQCFRRKCFGQRFRPQSKHAEKLRTILGKGHAPEFSHITKPQLVPFV